MKRFLEWIALKERLDSTEPMPPYVSERDVWWASLGENVGSEVNGKSHDFTRPVLILKKLTYGFYLVVPHTTRPHEGSWYVHVLLRKVDNYICLNQIRTIDYRRLHSRLGQISTKDFKRVHQGFRELYV